MCPLDLANHICMEGKRIPIVHLYARTIWIIWEAIKAPRWRVEPTCVYGQSYHITIPLVGFPLKVSREGFEKGVSAQEKDKNKCR